MCPVVFGIDETFVDGEMAFAIRKSRSYRDFNTTLSLFPMNKQRNGYAIGEKEFSPREGGIYVLPEPKNPGRIERLSEAVCKALILHGYREGDKVIADGYAGQNRMRESIARNMRKLGRSIQETDLICRHKADQNFRITNEADATAHSVRRILALEKPVSN